MRFEREKIALGALVASLAGASAAHAQDRAEAPSRDDIVVAATKLGRTIAETDGQAVIVSRDELTRTNTLNLDQLARSVGDLTILQRGNRVYNSVTLRGQSSVDFYNPTVQFYVDGVPQDQATFGQALPLDIAQVELLYGPQGTLYGRGAIGGVVNVVTERPAGNAIRAQGTIGERTREGSALAAVELAPDRLFADIAFGYQDQRGEYRALADAARLGDNEARSGRLRLHYAPDDSRLTALVTLSRQVTHSTEEQYVAATDFATRTAFPAASHYRLRHNMANLRLDYDLGNARLSSISAYQARDFDRTVFGFASPETQKTFTQELRIASQGPGQLSYVGGIYYEHTDFTFTRPDFGQIAAQTLQSVAIFGETTVAITEQLDITAGGRFEYNKIAARAAAPGIDVDNSADFMRFSPKVALGYGLDEQTRIYAVFSTGFKAGGFTRFVTPETIDFAYDPEKVISGEIGLRTRTWNDRLGLSLAGYVTRSSDYQYYVGFEPNQFLANVGNVVSKGVEGRLDLRLDDGWEFDATATFNRARFTRYDSPLNPGVDLADRTLPYAPRLTGRARIARSIALPDDLGRLHAQVDATWSSRVHYDETNTLGQKAYALLNASLSWELNDHLTLQLVATNLGDKTYAPYHVALGPGLDFYQLAPSREVSGRLQLSF